jgi:hypothetical protein
VLLVVERVFFNSLNLKRPLLLLDLFFKELCTLPVHPASFFPPTLVCESAHYTHPSPLGKIHLKKN